MSVIGTKRTCLSLSVMSGFGGKADIRGTLRMSAFDSGRARLTEGFRRQRMAEQREENKKLCAWQRWFFAFSKLKPGGPGWVVTPGFPIARPFRLFVFSTRYRRLCEVSESK